MVVRARGPVAETEPQASLWLTVLLAALLWFITFYLTWSTFWIKISCSAALLALLSLRLRRGFADLGRLNGRAVLLGLGSAVALYLIFWAGKQISLWVFPFADQQIGGIYAKGEGTPTGIIFVLLLFVTGPCEELYWRGYLQRGLMRRFGNRQGWLLATALYAGVHIWSFNIMLIGAAGVAGAFWGALYWRLGNLTPVIVSHSVWSAVIFTMLKLG